MRDNQAGGIHPVSEMRGMAAAAVRTHIPEQKGDN
jgi:hypothetical protein